MGKGQTFMKRLESSGKSETRTKHLEKSDLQELMTVEATHFQGSKKYLGASADLVGDLELVYKAIPPLMKSPGGDIQASDELFALLAVLHELWMCEMLLVKGASAAMRMYLGDSFTHLRRAVEACAFAGRMSKHHALARVWAEAGTEDDSKYRAYRRAFRTEDVFPNKKHPDHDEILSQLKDKFDLCSRLIHGSPFGMAAHFHKSDLEVQPGTWRIKYFDMPNDVFISAFFQILGTHCLIVRFFGQILKSYAIDPERWQEEYEKEYQYVAENLQRHFQKWGPTIAALSKARNDAAKKRPRKESPSKKPIASTLVLLVA